MDARGAAELFVKLYIYFAGARVPKVTEITAPLSLVTGSQREAAAEGLSQPITEITMESIARLLSIGCTSRYASVCI